MSLRKLASSSPRLPVRHHSSQLSILPRVYSSCGLLGGGATGTSKGWAQSCRTQLGAGLRPPRKRRDMRPGLAWPWRACSPWMGHGWDEADWIERRDGGRAARPLGVENVISTRYNTALVIALSGLGPPMSFLLRKHLRCDSASSSHLPSNNHSADSWSLGFTDGRVSRR